MRETPAPEARSAWVAVAACAGAMLASFGLRALAFPRVFQAGGVVFAPGDSTYHVRRTLYGFENFPRVLLSDSYVNYPDGAPIPWPPLFDIVCAAVARLVASDVAGFERVMAWAPPVFGALTVVPLFVFIRRRASLAAATLGSLCYACVPTAVSYARVGNPDHHCAVAFVGACWLVATLSLVEAGFGDDERRLRRVALCRAAAALALLFTWHGSLLYLGLGEAIVMAVGVFAARGALLRVQVAAAAGVAAVAAALLTGFPEPLGGWYSSIAPSRLHLLALAAVACVGAVAAWRCERDASPFVRTAWVALSGMLFVACVLALPGPRAGLVPAFEFMSMTDGVGAVTSEQRPLFALFGRDPGRDAALVWGGWAWWIPLAPLLAVAFARRAGAATRARFWQGLGLAFWCAVLGFLALSQRRYGNDLAPGFAIAVALGGHALVRLAAVRFGGSPTTWGAGAALAFALSLGFAVPGHYVQQARGAWAWARANTPAERARPSPALTVHRFARAIRLATPETAGYLDPAERPEYGIVSHANLGHTLQYVARRATPTDPFWAYIGPENWERAFGLLAAKDEAVALRLARELRARYLVTSGTASPESVAGRLHASDGLVSPLGPRVERFRLVTEVAGAEATLGRMARRASRGGLRIPYKLFEVVEGAVIEVAAPAGTWATARIGVRAPTGRRFGYQARVRVGTDGIARIRVPYASGASGTVETDASYVVRSGPRRTDLTVTERDVASGGVVRVSLED